MNVNVFLRRSAAAAVLAVGVPALAQPMTAVLKLRDRVSMETLALNVQNPLSDHYKRFYTPEEIRDLAGPSQAEYDQLLALLKNQGFTVTSESPTHLWISVKGDSSKIESTFATKIQFNGKMHQRVAALSIPMMYSLIESVGGLDNTRKAHPKLKFDRNATPQDDTSGGVPQATIKAAYGLAPLYAAGLTGKGQDIAVATYSGFHIANVQQFYQLSGLNPVPNVDQVAFNGTAVYDANSAMETELDAEFTGMIAPGANIHVFASADNSDAGELAMFTAILDDNRAKVVNYSWGSCETGLSAQHKSDMATVFARAVAQGVNIMVASGDSGSDSCQDGTTAADWPGASPNVVAVGGTTFGQNGSALAETAWSGSGGGISALWDLPTWQKLSAPYVKRSYPDVAFNADPNSGQGVYTENNGVAGWLVIGGTSMAAPQWSGFMALVGEARAQAGKPTLGFLNPAIYGLSTTDRASDFNDVTSGSNGAYTAGPGWDAVTGWGSMNANNLLKSLEAQ